jgi:osmotically-inducible protein OsmY
MRSTRAFILGLGTAFAVDRVRARRRAARLEAPDDATIEHLVLGDALPAAGVSAEEVEVTVDDGVVSLTGSVQGTAQADALVQRAYEVPGVRDVAAMLRVERPDAKAA